MHNENDYKGVTAIQNSIKNAIKGLVLTEPVIFKDKMFGHWATLAMINLLVDLTLQNSGNKESFINAINTIWDQKLINKNNKGS